MISVENIVMEFSARPVLNGVSFMINPRDRIALVGKNGAGKTTMLRLLTGEYEPTSGRISMDKGLQIGYLPQVMLHNEGTTLREETLTPRTPSPKGEGEDNWEDESEKARMVAEADRTLIGLGFTREDFDRQCSEFSGGWRMRIELAKILLSKPDLLLLDEPTNHLDIESIQWLEQWITQAPCAVVLVSHDRAFIDNVTNRTIEISLGRIYDYNVNYSHFVELRKERHEQQVRAYENQQKMIAEAEDFIERFRYKPTKAVQVQSRIKMLEKLERLEVDQEDNSRLRLKFPPAPRSGDYPVICETLSFAYPLKRENAQGAEETCFALSKGKPVFSDATFTIKRGEKVAFVGKNGEGKTTMVRCIMGELNDYSGVLKIGHNVKIGYFAQNQAALLDGEATVFDTIDRVAVGDIRTKIKDILGAFMFGGEASEKRVKFLSGGERSRLAMIRLLLEPVNLLILDEPTNHLDMRSKDVLKDAIKDFDGTVIVVSHDRDFLDGLVEKVYEFGGGQVKEHLGGIYDWLRKKPLSRPNGAPSSLRNDHSGRFSIHQGQGDLESSREIDRALRTGLRAVNSGKAGNTGDTREQNSGALDYAAQKAAAAERRKKEKQIAEVEKELERLEVLKAALEEELNVPDNQTQENFQRYEKIKHEIEQKEYEWMILSED